jgi:hypothetical protein
MFHEMVFAEVRARREETPRRAVVIRVMVAGM